MITNKLQLRKLLLTEIKIFSDREIKSIVILLTCLLGIITLQNNHRQKYQPQIPNYLQTEQKQQRALNFQKLLPNLGFNNLKADWIFLQFVQYFGDSQARDEIGYSLVPEYFSIILNYDPRFTDAYLTLSTANTIYAGKPKQTVNLMERVLQVIESKNPPDTTLLWTAKGSDELLFLGDNQAARFSYQRAAYSASLQNNEEGKITAERHLTTAKFLATNPDTTASQIAAWKMVLPNLRDRASRAEVITKIQALETKLKFQQAAK
jgi:hypothetical protein